MTDVSKGRREVLVVRPDDKAMGWGVDSQHRQERGLEPRRGPFRAEAKLIVERKLQLFPSDVTSHHEKPGLFLRQATADGATDGIRETASSVKLWHTEFADLAGPATGAQHGDFEGHQGADRSGPALDREPLSARVGTAALAGAAPLV